MKQAYNSSNVHDVDTRQIFILSNGEIFNRKFLITIPCYFKKRWELFSFNERTFLWMMVSLRKTYERRTKESRRKKYKHLNSLTMFCILFQSDCEPKISKSFTNLIVHERFKNCVWIFCLKACPTQPTLTQPFTKRYTF